MPIAKSPLIARKSLTRGLSALFVFVMLYPWLQGTAAADWTIEDLDGDSVVEELMLPPADGTGEVWLALSGGAPCRLLVLGEAESLALELCGRINDLDQDGGGELLITIVRATDDGGQAVRARLYVGAGLCFSAQILGGWNGSGVPSTTSVQMPGDVVPDGTVDSGDLVVVLEEAADIGCALARCSEKLAADWGSDGSVGPADVLCLVEKISAGDCPQEAALRLRLELELSSNSADIGAIFGFLKKLLGIVDCVWCAEHFAGEVQEASAWIEDTNARLRACRECMETGNCPIEEEIECHGLYRRAIKELAERCRAAGGSAAGCIRKCAGALEVFP